MKNYIKYLPIIAIPLFAACNDDDKQAPGNPMMDFNTKITNAYFGDSIPFSIVATDDEVPLSTLKAKIFYGEEQVSETVIRTKDSGKEYSGKIYVPFVKNIPNGTASIKFTLQNIHFTIVEKEFDLPLQRPDFPSLTLITDENEYKMNRTDLYTYEVKDNFDQKINAIIKADKYGENGNEIYFGWNSGGIVENCKENIYFSNSKAGEYTIAFNTMTYEASPFISLKVNDKDMEMIDPNNYKVDLTLNAGSNLTITGIPDFDQWWIDSDYLTRKSETEFTFNPIAGEYRIQADFKNQYLIIERLKNGNPATLESDGSGALWIIGDGIGKPSFATNQVSWTTEKALCLPQISPKVYQLTFVAGEQVKHDDINFKFFHQKGWGGEFSNQELTSTSDIIFIGDGENGRDKGNLGIYEGKELKEGSTYRMTIDITAGTATAVLTLEEIK